MLPIFRLLIPPLSCRKDKRELLLPDLLTSISFEHDYHITGFR